MPEAYAQVPANGRVHASPVKPSAAGTRQTIPVDARARSVTLRAVDEQGNVSHPLTVRR